MINLIQEIREDVIKHFDNNALLPNTEEIYFSPDRNFFFKSNYYLQTDNNRNWTVTKIQIFQTDTDEKIFEFIRNDDSLFHGWLTVDNKRYLLLSEDSEGKSIFDLDDRKFYSYSFEDDKFIWCEYYPSPDGKKLAIVGCYWACPYEIVVFDTTNPTSFPYKELYRQDTFQESVEWLDNATLKVNSKEGNSKIVKVE
jgi:hypothetical protein